MDLLATKLKIILQRTEAKDYRDIAALLRAGNDLATGLGAARDLFGPNFQPSEALKALAYFADGDLRTLPTAEQTLLVKASTNVGSCPAYPPLHPAWTEPVTRANRYPTTRGMHPAGYPAEQLSGQERGLHDGCAFGRGRFLFRGRDHTATTCATASTAAAATQPWPRRTRENRPGHRG